MASAGGRATASYEESWLERIGAKNLLSQPARMVLRNVQRQPGRTFSSVVGIAFAVAMLIVGLFFIDAIDELLDVQFNVAQRQDITVTFVEPASARALYEITHLPGVIYTEPTRTVPARLRHGHRYRQTAITGLVNGAELSRVIDTSLAPVTLPPEGLVLSTKLAEILEVERGDTVTLEVLEGSRPVREVMVTDLVEEYMGTAAYMETQALRRLMREGRNLSGTYLRVDSAWSDELYKRLKATPAVAGVALKNVAIRNFQETMDQTMGVMIFFSTFFASIIAFGVVYNAARVNPMTRKLASSRLRSESDTRAAL